MKEREKEKERRKEGKRLINWIRKTDKGNMDKV
jgi:hypothetical protein